MRARAAGFTIVELLVVMAIILVLAGLVLATSGYVHNKAARSRAEAEIAAISSAIENYKIDNGIYPRGDATPTPTPSGTPGASDTDKLNARADGNPAATPIPNNYTKASLFLYKTLSGDTDGDRASNGGNSYFSFRPNQLDPTDQSAAVLFIADPFGNSYGYSTANQFDGTGYNPTFDFWSTAGKIDTGNPPDSSAWIKNW